MNFATIISVTMAYLVRSVAVLVLFHTAFSAPFSGKDNNAAFIEEEPVEVQQALNILQQSDLESQTAYLMVQENLEATIEGTWDDVKSGAKEFCRYLPLSNMAETQAVPWLAIYLATKYACNYLDANREVTAEGLLGFGLDDLKNRQAGGEADE